MRDLGTVWSKCHNGQIDITNWRYQRRLNINGRYFLDNEIVDITFDRGLLYNTLSFGNCIASKIKTSLKPMIPLSFSSVGFMQLEIRVKTLDDGNSDWHMFGKYSLKSAKEEDGKWILEGYDAFGSKKADSIVGTGGDYFLNPLPATSIVSEVTRGWIDIDSRSGIDKNMKLSPYVVEGIGKDEKRKYIFSSYTRRQILSMVAQLHGGNFYITEEGKLRLMTPTNGSPVTKVLPSNTKRLVDGGPIKFEGISIRYNEEEDNAVYVLGNKLDALDMFNPLATTYSANVAYRRIKAMTYRSHFITSTEIDPAVELGDMIEVNGHRVNLWSVSYSNRMFADINIPNEVDQYVWKDSPDRDDECILTSGIKGNNSYWKNTVVGSITYKTYIGSDNCIILDVSPNTSYTTSLNYSFKNATIGKVVLLESSIGRSMVEMFANYRRSKVDLTEFNTDECTNMNSMFANSNISDFSFQLNTSNVTNMDNMFVNTSSKKYEIFFDISNVQNMRYMFKGTTTNEIDLSGMTVSTNRPLTESLFEGTSAEVIKLPYGFNAGTPNKLFKNASNVKHLDVSTVSFYKHSGSIANTAQFSEVFDGMASLETLNISDAKFGTTTYYGSPSGLVSINISGVTPKYIDARNVNNKDVESEGLPISERICRRITFENLQHKMTLNLSGDYIFYETTDRDSATKSNFFPNKYNQENKLTVICNSLNIDKLKKLYMLVHGSNTSTNWADHNIEFINNPEFEWKK